MTVTRERSARALAAVGIGAGLLLSGGPAVAEEGAEAVDEEIVVTALRRETNLLETPLAVSAFTGDDLERTGADGLEEFLQFAPGVTVDRSASGQQTIYIRGLASAFGNTPVGMYIDEVPFTALTVTLSPDVRAWDLERVEVLRGPQGTLYGASSLGGTIRILTRDPTHEAFQAKVDLAGSSTDDGGDNSAFKGAVNIPLVPDRLSLRVAATDESYDGWIDQVKPLFGLSEDNHNDFDVETQRAKLLWTISDRVDVVLGYWRTESEAPDGNLADDDGVSSTLFNAQNFLRNESDLYSVEFSADFDRATFTSSTSTFEFASDVHFVDFVGGRSLGSIEIFSQEFRLTSTADEGSLIWNVGAIYIENETMFDFYFNLPGFFVNQSIQNNESESWALYGEVTFPLADTLLGTVGLRYYRDDVTRNDSQFLIPQPEIDNEFTDWSPRLNLAWMPGDGALYYTTLSKGFRSGLTQPSIAIAAAAFVGVGIDRDVESEDAWNFELGTKLTLLDGALTLDAVAYYIQWRDQQAQILLDPVVFAFVNAGDATARGFEWAATWRAAERLTLTATGNFNETTYSDDVFDTFGRVVFEDGAQLQFVPEYTVTGAADYVHPFGNGWSFVARASLEMVGERTITDNSLTSISGDDNKRINARFGVENDRWGVYLFGENLNNDDNRINPAGTALARGYASRYRPSTIGLNVRFDY